MTTIDHAGLAAPGTRTVLRRVFVLALIVLVLATLYVHEAYVLDPRASQWAHLRPFRWWLVPHVAGGAIALVLGPLQFSTSLRRRSLTLHRWLGRFYVLAVLVSASLSITIVLRFEAPINHWVMGTMGALWLATTVAAWLAAWNGAIAQHRLWIGRSYGLTFTFVTTRFIPDVVFPGLNYFDTTALYWLLIVAALLLPDLMINGRALVRRQR